MLHRSVIVASQLRGPRSRPAACLVPGFFVIGATLADATAQDTWARARTHLDRMECAMAYDTARGRVVLFGGRHGALDDACWLDDTWEWDGQDWLLRTSPVRPSGRAQHAMAYDAARKRVVLFAGVRNGVHQQDTWEWDGVQWLPQTPATKPPDRAPAVPRARDPVGVGD